MSCDQGVDTLPYSRPLAVITTPTPASFASAPHPYWTPHTEHTSREHTFALSASEGDAPSSRPSRDRFCRVGVSFKVVTGTLADHRSNVAQVVLAADGQVRKPGILFRQWPEGHHEHGRSHLAQRAALDGASAGSTAVRPGRRERGCLVQASGETARCIQSHSSILIANPHHRMVSRMRVWCGSLSTTSRADS